MPSPQHWDKQQRHRAARGLHTALGLQGHPTALHGFRAAQMVWDGLSPQPCQGNSQESQDFAPKSLPLEMRIKPGSLFP